MLLSRVYALCDSERVAETLAILLERDCEYRGILPPALEELDLGRLPPPALLIDARDAPIRAAPPVAFSPSWRSARVLRVGLQTEGDLLETRRAVADALRNDGHHDSLSDLIREAICPLEAELRPRLAAARCLIGMAHQDEGLYSHSIWRELCREQLLGIVDSCKFMTAPVQACR
jgi:hypothetical protein